MTAPEVPTDTRAATRKMTSSGPLVWKVGDQLVDLAAKDDKAEAREITFDDPEGRQVYHHSTAHIMAEAVQDLFPGTKVTIGPADRERFLLRL